LDMDMASGWPKISHEVTELSTSVEISTLSFMSWSSFEPLFRGFSLPLWCGIFEPEEEMAFGIRRISLDSNYSQMF
jgi:hypothetical protein